MHAILVMLTCMVTGIMSQPDDSSFLALFVPSRLRILWHGRMRWKFYNQYIAVEIESHRFTVYKKGVELSWEILA